MNSGHYVIEYEPKAFKQRRPDGNGGYTWKLDGVRRVLYRLPQLLAADPTAWVFLPEGEKDVDSLAALDLVATCNSGGAGKWRDEYTDALKGRRVIILPDADKTGREHGEAVARSLHGKAAEVKILDLRVGAEGFPGKDASDWVAWRDSQTPEELGATLLGMADAAPLWTPKADAPADGQPHAVLRPADSIITRPVAWLWLGRIPLGKVSLIIGHPGDGKTLLTDDLAARLSRGFALPDGAPCEAGSAIILSGEDDPADTIIPRLKAAGANLTRILIFEGIEWKNPDNGEVRLTLPQLDQHMSAIREAIKRTGARLLVIDPISSFVGDVDDHRNSELRGLLSALAAIAAELNCAIICISHLRKAGGLAVHQAVGSLAYTAAARAVWALVRDPENNERRLLLPVKINLSREATGLAFTIESNSDDQPTVCWESAPVQLRADDVLNPETRPGRPPVEREEAEEWLSDKLAAGPRLAAEIIETAKAEGISLPTLRRAKAEIGVRAVKEGFQGDWKWFLSGRTGS